MAAQQQAATTVVMNCDVSRYELVSPTPSEAAGVPAATEQALRIWGCEFIQHAGLLLRRPQTVMACAQILLQRFYYRQSCIDFAVESVATACLFLAAKVEEAPVRLRDVLLASYHVRLCFSRRRSEFPPVLDTTGAEFFDLKAQVIEAELRVLQELGFCVHVQHPHKLIVFYQMMLGLQDDRELAQLAWNYMNDGLRTNIFVRFQVSTIACACLHLATVKRDIAMPEWWLLFDSATRDVEEICATILQLYTLPRRSLEDLQQELLPIKLRRRVGGGARHQSPAQPSDVPPAAARAAGAAAAVAAAVAAATSSSSSRARSASPRRRSASPPAQRRRRFEPERA